jgi:putative metallohydrolase (TIGR04338 family)
VAYGYDGRDTQRAKVYRAENAAGRGKEFETVPEIEAYLTRCFSHRWFHRHYPEITEFRVRDGRRRRNAGGRGYMRVGGGVCQLTMPKWSRCELVVLHELAHGITDIVTDYRNAKGVAPHGWEFCEIFLDLVRHYMGAAAGERLRRSFRKHRVRYYPPRKGRKMTPEQREAACARLAAARAAKEGRRE